ncbi:hypothetical protein AB4Z52_32370 [Rhizobium sp. 2YAF20]|uniref:hypothetical protein n=2 Tax=Rhizobium sp. 2YAF20 TaxID=3233027 RepID=UPI003F9A7D68
MSEPGIFEGDQRDGALIHCQLFLKTEKDNEMSGLLTLRDFRGAIITVECKACNRHGELDRKALVKQHGAGLSFADLRRRVALGCEKMNGEDGVDRCQTRFPCLTEAGIVIGNVDGGA